MLVALAVYLAVEITVLVLVGQAVGFWGLLGVLVLSAVLGAWAIRREGRRSMTALMDAARRGRPAEAEVADGMYVALAGVLLVVPGLLSTLAALVLLVPPVRRALARRAADRAVRAGSARVGPSVTVVGAGGPAWGPASPAGPGRLDTGSFRGTVIEGEVVDRGDDGRPST
ncbi:FxsA family protein [Actinomycetospora aeridis]|uniref:FxsA family protein n=1 Tax=Actinomycetospora aeridis TaxID=3129231 RepID=A0ABU8N0X5_9PSEU